MENLSEDLAWEIVGRTSPIDASRLAMVSKWLKYVADSDVVWEKFMPSDWVEKSNHNRKKDLCVSLCLTPIFPRSHFGKLGFFIDKRSGNKHYIVVARNLMLPWSSCMFSREETSSTEVAVVSPGCSMDIRGKIKVRMLSPNIIYGAYLVYKLDEYNRERGLRSLNATVCVMEHEAQTEAESRALVVHLPPRSSRSTQNGIKANFPITRDDGWLEILMGTFYNDPRYHGDYLEARLMDLNPVGRRYDNFIVNAIHFRPHCAL